MAAKRGAIKAQKSELVLSEILTVAASLIAERGFRSVSLDDIADEVGYTKSALYHYVSSKHQLLALVFERNMGLFANDIGAIASSSTGHVAKFRAMIEAHTRLCLQKNDWSAVFFREDHELPPMDRQAIHRMLERYLELFKSVYRDGVKDGSFKRLDPAIVVSSILGATNAMISLHRANPDRPLEGLVQEVCEIALSGVENS